MTRLRSPTVILSLGLTGRDHIEYSAKILVERGYPFTTDAERDTLRKVTEKLSYLASDFDTEMKESSESNDKGRTYEHPHGNIIAVRSGHHSP